MSRTTIMAIYPGEKAEGIKELSNSWGSAPPVWEAMAAKYLNVFGSYNYPNKGYMQLGDELWDLWKRRDIPVEHRMVFMMTFDCAYVAKADYPRMAAAIRRFLADFPPHPGHSNHWAAIAELLESNPEFPGIGLWCTSVSRNPFSDDFDDNDKPIPFDWGTAYSICERIEKNDGEALDGTR
jgi:hypothetical protein